jgi:hypothetical protein
MANRTYHVDGTLPEHGEIFVFGSNTAGIHGAGAALKARVSFSAVLGVSEGLTGQAYAIPTRMYIRSTKNIVTLPLATIRKSVIRFCDYTKEHAELKWWVTGVACGYAGYSASQIASFFKEAVNCSFPSKWEMFLTREIDDGE